jgi:5,10-methylenetetrahydrofolate reductase
VTDLGVPVVSTLTCRNRPLVEIGEELDRLAAIELLASIHCVTGDHPAARLGLESPVSFGLDSFELLDLAAPRGAPLSVAESPAGAPASWRPERLAAKAAAGASMAVLNHAGEVEDLVAFADEVHALAPGLAMIAPVPVIADRRSAEALRRFPGLRLPAGFIDTILAAEDPLRRGCDQAVAMVAELEDSGRFAGINLSGAATTGAITDRARLMTAIIEQCGAN